MNVKEEEPSRLAQLRVFMLQVGRHWPDNDNERLKIDDVTELACRNQGKV